MNYRINLTDFSLHRALSDLTCAPSGKLAAFLTTQADIENNTYHKKLWLYDGSSVQQLQVPEGFRSFVWETDTVLMISWKCADKTAVRRYDVPSAVLGEPTVLDVAAKAVLPLPDGRYAVTVDWDKYAEDPRVHQDYEIFEELPLRQNAVGYVSGHRTELFVYSPEDGSMTPVANAPFDVERVGLTPDKKHIVYSGRAYKDMRFLDHGIWRYTLETGKQQEVLSQKKKMFVGYWACDNESVYYTATDCKQYGFGQIKYLYRFDCCSGETEVACECQRNIGLTEVVSDGNLGSLNMFSLRSKNLYFGSTDGYETHVYRYNAETQIQKLLPVNGSTDALDAFDDGSLLIIAKIGQRLQELYRIEDGKAVRITGFNEEFYQKTKPIQPTHFNYTNDGVDLDGWVILPDGFDPRREYAAILDIHGGPRLVYGETYFHEMQAWAAMGFVVMYCNPRGGSGKGNEFSNLWSPRTIGTWDYNDTMAFVDEVLRRYPNINPKRLGVTGGSYGGFLTNWIIGQTGRFAAAASQRSIANWFGNALTSDNGYYDWDRIADTDPWTDVEEMWRVSPIHYAKNATTPTLFIHAFEDYRCPFMEGLQMFTCLKMNGVPARMCAFYGENHELSRRGKPTNRVKRLNEITSWLDHYLNASPDPATR